MKFGNKFSLSTSVALQLMVLVFWFQWIAVSNSRIRAVTEQNSINVYEGSLADNSMGQYFDEQMHTLISREEVRVKVGRRLLDSPWNWNGPENGNAGQINFASWPGHGKPRCCYKKPKCNHPRC
eukprot:TRINITY_DN83628_c0_g1_i1.p1 TRINITY_DN83628_c0_g1~~TRINITY_DN83628_c0_g1_i1.p1  ORF type:complete len:124 (+),score=7.49 TRINITY_DN83628_c0_g1_i1:189-560(+)